MGRRRRTREMSEVTTLEVVEERVETVVRPLGNALDPGAEGDRR